MHGIPGKIPPPNLDVNETNTGTVLSNQRGTVSIAHWDVPDCGNIEFFINLKSNPHLDSAYGGFCVFAEVQDEDSFRVVDSIAAVILLGQHPKIIRIRTC
uniref:PPIase cyclophilin-type domain-containing protein n=1 Tax=Proboscia inermis TaxID=420281 RepID=A0A7S0BWW6_9STRA